jgi:hypothetical protein
MQNAVYIVVVLKSFLPILYGDPWCGAKMDLYSVSCLYAWYWLVQLIMIMQTVCNGSSGSLTDIYENAATPDALSISSQYQSTILFCTYHW